jgi:spermidine synthase
MNEPRRKWHIRQPGYRCAMEPGGTVEAPSAPDRRTPPPRDPHAARAPLPLLVLVFTGGAASLGAEIAAARLLAPDFGASTIIWANTIGVVLVALSVGYWLGGRFADRHPHERGLRLTVLAAAVLLAVVPLVAGPFLHAAVRALDNVDAGAFIGSLAAVLVLVALPVLLLGAISPWAIRLAVTSVEQAGQVAGRLYAVSTIGSLLGVFLSALVLIPLVGTQRTFIGFATALALAAAASGLPRRALLVPLVLGALLALPPGVTKPGSGGEKVVFEQETPYQYLRVVQVGDERRLELNEGQAVHSLYRPNTVLTDGYWDGYSVLPFARLDAPPRRMAMLGNAGGTVARAYARLYPGTAIDGVEIDGDVSAVGRRYFDMRNPRLRMHTEDARPFLRRARARYDVIGIDAYRQPYIPFYLTTREFFALVRRHLTARGVVIINVGHPKGESALERTLAATLRTAFPNVMRDPIEPTNTMLVASVGDLSTKRLAAARVSPQLQPTLQAAAAQLGPALGGGSVYTDDKAPVEWLVDTSIVHYAAGNEP